MSYTDSFPPNPSESPASGTATPTAENAEVTAEENVVEMSAEEMQANNTVKSYVIGSMALGLVPVPVFDFVAIVALQLKMVHSLSNIYGVKYSENMAKSIVMSLIGGIVPVSAGVGLASLIKFIPGLGSVAGAAGVSVLAGALTYAVGRVFTEHFESGGSLLDFSPEKMRNRFRQAFQKGKEEADTLQEEAKAQTAASAA